MSVFEDSRKVQAFGSSLAVTLPAFFAKVCGLEKGTEVKVVYGLDGVLLIMKNDEPVDMREGLYEILEKLKDLEFQIQRYVRAQNLKNKSRR